MSAPFSLKKRALSFRYALRGIFILVRSEHNAWIHMVMTILVIAGACFFSVSKLDWIFLILAMGLVWIAEALNTAIEVLCNRVSQEHDRLIQKTKDVAAGGVFIAAITAACIGIFVFYPYFSAKFIN